jgi:hypothetical protein
MKYRDEMQKGFTAELLKQGIFGAATATPTGPKAIKPLGAQNSGGGTLLDRMAFGAGKHFMDHGRDRGKQLAQQGIDSGLKSGKMEGLKNIMAGNPVYPQNAPASVSPSIAKVQAQQNYQPQFKKVDVGGGKMQSQLANPAPQASTWDHFKSNLANKMYQGDRAANLGSKEFLGGVNEAIGDKSYGVASMNDQGKLDLNPGNTQWGRVWDDHKGKIMGGLGLLAIPLLAKMMFGQRQQQAPNIVINNGGSVQPNMQRAFQKYQ